jgi:hypothetical protein
MRLKEHLILALTLTLLLGLGCAPRRLASPGGVALKPGDYLEASYRAPDFDPEQVSFILEPFTVQQAQGVAPEVFQTLLKAELAKALADNGLSTTPSEDQPPCPLSGTVEQVRVKGSRFRWLIGQISGDLAVSGTIRRGEEVIFAFQDRVRLVSPINPGPPPPKETELLLKQVAHIFATHLLNELLLQGFAPGGG